MNRQEIMVAITLLAKLYLADSPRMMAQQLEELLAKKDWYQHNAESYRSYTETLIGG